MSSCEPSEPCESVVYMLHSPSSGRTYVGCTLNLAHRVRQHNGEISGGARQTSRQRDWAPWVVVRGFRTRREALSFEYSWRRANRAAGCGYGVPGRLRALDALLARERWSRNAPLASEIPLRVEWPLASAPSGSRVAQVTGPTTVPCIATADI